MGYDVHLVKRGHGSDEGNAFTTEEWNSIVRELGAVEWVSFFDGAVSSKYPSPEQLVALVRVAQAHGWSVQGDDGEEYGLDGQPIRETPGPREHQGFFKGLIAAFANWRAKRHIRSSMKGVVCAFKAGDRVKDSCRTGGVVTKVDPDANHGMGLIKVRYPDGVELRYAFIGNGLERED
jgi:hypothetical protein